MNIIERIKVAMDNYDGEIDSVDKVIAVAYIIGREDATKELSDKVNDIFAQQKERAKQCRYHEMALNVQGDINYVYSTDYAQDVKSTFGYDETDV